MSSRLIKLSILLIFIALVVYTLMPSPLMVEASRVTKAPLIITVTEEGKTRVIDRFVISAPVSGYLRRLKLDVGDEVTQRQIIAELEPLKSDILDSRARAQAEARLKAAESALQVALGNMDAAKADLDYAQAEFDRKSKLVQAQTISQDEADIAFSKLRRTKANHSSAQFAVEVAKFEVEVAKTALEQYSSANGDTPLELVQVKAPVAGQVLKIERESEGAVTVSEPILELGDPKALEIEVDVLSIDAVKIQPGSRVSFTHWGGEGTLEGTVRLIEPVGFTKVSALGVEEQRVLVIADLSSPPDSWRRLGDGYRVEANFIIWEGKDVLQLPASSLFRSQGKWAVYAIENNVTKLKVVEVGQTNGLQTQVLSGLSENDLVVTYPESSLTSGIKVKLQPS